MENLGVGPVGRKPEPGAYTRVWETRTWESKEQEQRTRNRNEGTGKSCGHEPGLGVVNQGLWTEDEVVETMVRGAGEWASEDGNLGVWDKGLEPEVEQHHVIGARVGETLEIREPAMSWREQELGTWRQGTSE